MKRRFAVLLPATLLLMASGTSRVALAAAPTATTSAATMVMTTSAVLNGAGNPNAEPTTGWFRVSTTNPGSCNDTFGTRVPATSGTGLGTGIVNVVYSITTMGLTPGTTHYFCAITSNASGTAFGTVLSFTTPGPPIVVTNAATNITSSNAQLNGSANPTAATTTGWFRFSTTNPVTCNDSFGTRVPVTGGAALGAGTSAANYAFNTNTVVGLTPGTTYHYCAIASNTHGTSVGAVQSFTTPAVVPSVSTGSVTALTATTATLNGSANPGGGATTAWFRYTATNPGSCSDTFGTRVPSTGGSDLGSGNSSVAFLQAITGLVQGTIYYYCAIASNSAGTSLGSLLTFTTPTAPAVTTNAVSAIANTTATLSGAGDPNGDAATGWFRVHTANPGGCSDSGGTRVPATGGSALGSGTSAITYTQPVTDLTPNTTYYVCAIASNSLGTSFGAVVTFTTRDQPTVVTAAATSVATTSAQLNGSANPNGATTTGWYRVGTADPGTCSDSFGTRVPLSGAASLGTGTTAVNFAFNTNTALSLTPGTLYYYCAAASNVYGTSFGAVMTFTTPPAVPSVSTSAATVVTATTATLNGSANPGGGSATGWFRYATSNPGTCNDSFGTRVPAGTGGSSLGSGNAAVAYSQPITGLALGTTYYYCAIASNSAGTGFGSVTSFVTLSAPTVTTSAASAITNVQAQLNGTGDPNGDAATGWFRLGTTNPGTCDDSFGTRVPTTGSVTLGSGTSAVSYSQPASGLTPNTVYYYCAVASNSLGTSFGSVQSFQTFAQPTVTTSGATSVAATTAQLNGSANPNGATATGWFRISTTDPVACSDSFGTRVPASGSASLGAGRAALAYGYNTNTAISLTPGTVYYFCAIASNAYGTSFGSVLSFTTPAVQPSVSTSSATAVTSNSATINGSANPGGGATTGWFRYSPTNPVSCSDTFGTRVPATGGTALGSGNASVAFSQDLMGLAQGTTYYFCAIASNSLGTVFGSLLTFTTPTAPGVTTNAASGIGDTVATLNGAGDPNGSAATGWFRYATTSPGTCNDTFGTRVPATGGTDLGTGTSAISFAQSVSGLTPNTTYFYCAIASNALGTSFGAVVSFTTRAPAAVTTLAPTSVTTTTAQLNGSANPNGATTTAWFRLSPTDPVTCSDTVGNRVPASGTASLGAGTSAVNFTFNTNTAISLTPGTTYYYCAVATNSFGTSFGAVVSFTTPAAIPSVSTSAATAVTAATATLNGSANPGGGSTTGWFRYSPTFPGSCSETFGTRVPATGGSDLGSGNTAVAFSQPITGLAQGTTYYYCAIASNSAGTSFGTVTSFVTPTAPTVTTNAVSALLDTTVTFSGTANPNRDATTGWFRYSATNPVTCDDAFGTRVPASGGTALGSGSSGASYSQPVTGLMPNTTYFYCAIASNSLGTAFGSVVTFTTHDRPGVTTAAATSVTTTSAQLNGSADPNGATATGWFRFGTTDPGTCNDTFGTRLPTSGGAALGAGTVAVNYAYNTNTVLGLTPGTLYYYCAIASNVHGTSFGAVMSFTTTVALPSVSTNAASVIGATTATLNGTVNPGGGATTGWFRYSVTNPGSCNDSFGTRVPGTGGADLGSGNAAAAFSQPITGLALGTTYYYCAIASNSAGTAFGSITSFVTFSAPTVTTNAASGVTNLQATLSGSADPNGEATTGWFRLSTTNPGSCDDSFGTRVPTTGGVTLGAGTSPVSYTQPASGLASNTTYYYCAVASNSLGTSFGAVVSFTTFAQPAVTTSPATSVAATTAQLNGSANPNGATATGWFRISTTDPMGCSDSFGTRVPLSGSATLGAGRAAVSFGYNTNTAMSLTPGTTYYYCAVASNTYGASFGAVQSFTTPPILPSVSTSSASPLTSTTATLNGSANPGGATTTGWFRYTATNPGGCSDTFGTRIPSTGGSDLGAGNTSVAFTQDLTGLIPNTTYYYCAIASNSVGIAYGSLVSFRTPATPTVTTLAATPVTSMTATLNGSANPNGVTTSGWFRYGPANPGTCNDTFGVRMPASGGTSLGAGTTAISYSQPISALSPGTTYYFCALAQNTSGTSVGAVLSFTTPVNDQAPGVTTLAATAVAGTSATINGSANPVSATTTGWFRYATASPGSCNDTFGTRVPASGGTALGAGSSPVNYSEMLTGLAPGTTYYFCALAQNAAGTSVGSVLSFMTPRAPDVVTLAASGVGSTSATLNGSSTPNGATTTGWFRYATASPGDCNDSFGTRVPASGGAALGLGSTAVTYSEGLSGLAANTTYYYCAIASNAAGTTFGAVLSFVTPLAPEVVTLAASSVASTSATLNGSANPNGGATTGWFRYATTSPGTCNDSFGTRIPGSGGAALGAGDVGVAYSQALSNLAPNTTYYFCAIASNAVGTSFGTVLSFTATAAPTATTGPATAITGTGATLNGSGNPRMAAATGYFRYDTTSPGACNDSFGTRVPATAPGGTSLGSGTADVAFSETIAGLAQGTTYYTCAIVSNAEGTAFGAVVSFTTLAMPTVTTSAATVVASTSATFNGAANPGRDATVGYFRYGTTNPGTTCTDAFGTRAPATGGSSLGAGSASVAFSHNETGLQPGTTYYYCAVAQNAVGTAFGSVQSFVTLALPVVTTLAATGVSTSAATLNGQAAPNGAPTTGWFRYGTTDPAGACNDSYGTRVPATGGTALGSGNTAAPFSQPLTGLQPGTTYYFCAIAQSAVGTVAGNALMFTTSALAPTVTTSSVSGVASGFATLNGSANPNGGMATGWFRYGTTDPGTCNDSFGTRVPTGTGGSPLGAGTALVAFSEVISGLSGGVTYYFCAIASNSAGTSFGAVMSFRIDTPAPTVATAAATNLAARAATLNGSANPNATVATGWFRYDTAMPTACNDSFGTRAPLTGGTNLGAGTAAMPFSTVLANLLPNTTYYYCAIASNTGGAAFGNVLSFTTLAAAPTVRTLPVVTQTDGRKTLNGAANPHGMNSAGWFQYGTTDPGTCTSGFGTRVPTTDIPLGSGQAEVTLTTTLGDLPPGAYYYCAAASNALGTSYGAVVRFDVAQPGNDGGALDGGTTDGGADGGPGAGGSGGAGGGTADGGGAGAGGNTGGAGGGTAGRGGAGGRGGGAGGNTADGGPDAGGMPPGGGGGGCGCGLATGSPALGAVACLLIALCLARRSRPRKRRP